MRPESAVAAQLVAAGRVARVETRGRVSGRTASAAVGFVEEADGSILVAASDGAAHWARNLLADARCRVTVGERSWDGVAVPLEGRAAAQAVRELILKYGTPSESLGAGPVFRIGPVGATPRP